MRQVSAAISGFAALTAVLASTLPAQGTASISGQVTIQERPGERTEDLENTVVFLEPVGAASRARSLNPTNTGITLEKRQFSPRVRVVVEGSRIEFKNEDAFSHNVFSRTNGGFDTGTYGRGKKKDQTFKTAGVYSLYCNVHPRMTAYVIALRTPHFTQVGDDGRFRFDSVPPGQYKLNVWHDRTSMVSMDITVTAAGARNLRAELDARGYKYVQHKNKFGQVYTSTGGDRY